MAAQIIDGEAVAKAMNQATTQAVAELKAKGRNPHLVAVQVGETLFALRLLEAQCIEVQRVEIGAV